eukprot:gene6254-7253_t
MQSYTFLVDSKIEENVVSSRHKQVDASRLSVAVDCSEYEGPPRRVVQTSIDGSLISVGCNSFIYSAVEAYSYHHHLSIRPDDVWLAIVAQFSYYVNANSEALRNKFVDFEVKKKLVVEVEDQDLFTMDYPRLAALMTEAIAANITDPSIREWVMPSFTTTTPTDEMVGAVALMSTVKSYFDYELVSECGLPRVTLHGTLDDWKGIKDRVARLTEFELPGKVRFMAKWAKMLDHVVDQFIETAAQRPNIRWWNRICMDLEGESGIYQYSGWITVFAVFTEEGEWTGDEKSYIDERDNTKQSQWPVIDIEARSFPKGYFSTPVMVVDVNGDHETELIAGHIGIKIPVDNKTTIVPQLDCIINNSKNNANGSRNKNKNNKIINTSNNANSNSINNYPMGH